MHELTFRVCTFNFSVRRRNAMYGSWAARGSRPRSAFVVGRSGWPCRILRLSVVHVGQGKISNSAMVAPLRLDEPVCATVTRASLVHLWLGDIQLYVKTERVNQDLITRVTRPKASVLSIYFHLKVAVLGKQAPTPYCYTPFQKP